MNAGVPDLSKTSFSKQKTYFLKIQKFDFSHLKKQSAKIIN
jgi:hypothetical protein